MSTTKAFETMLIGHLPRLRAYAMLLTRNRHLAEDILQETAYRALRYSHQFIAGSNFAAWTYRILRNEFMTAMRRSKRPTLALDDVPPELLGERGDQDDVVLAHEVLRAMDTLRAPEREVLMLVSASGLSYEEVAELIKVSVGTVRSRLWRARRNLAHLLLGDVPSNMTERQDPKPPTQRLRMLADGVT